MKLFKRPVRPFEPEELEAVIKDDKKAFRAFFGKIGKGGRNGHQKNRRQLPMDRVPAPCKSRNLLLNASGPFFISEMILIV